MTTNHFFPKRIKEENIAYTILGIFKINMYIS